MGKYILSSTQPRLRRRMTLQEAIGQEVALRQRTMADHVQSPRRFPPPLSPAAPIEKRPWIDLPSGGESFIRLNAASVTLPAIGSEATVVTFTVPRGKYAVITAIANQFVGGGWTEGTGDLVWRLEEDGASIRGYENIIASLGSTSSPQNISPNRIRIFENQVVSLICNNVAVAVAGQPLLGLLAGYFYPLEQEGASSWL